MPSASSLVDNFKDKHLEEILFLCMLSKSGQLEIQYGGKMRGINTDLPHVHTGVRAHQSRM